MKKLASFVFAGTLAAGAASQQMFTGVITDTMCVKNHAPMKVTPDDKCVRECLQHDKSNKYALYDGRDVYVLSDQKTPEQFAARKVKVTGMPFQKTRILKVDSISAAN